MFEFKGRSTLCKLGHAYVSRTKKTAVKKQCINWTSRMRVGLCEFFFFLFIMK